MNDFFKDVFGLFVDIGLLFIFWYGRFMKDFVKLRMKWKCKWYEIELNRTWNDMNMSMIMNENEMIIWYEIELKWRWYECEYGNWN